MTDVFPFLIDLSESHLIPSRKLIKNWKVNKLAELCYLYFIGLFILLANFNTKKWARDYCASVADHNDFLQWRTNGNDLYVMLYALSSDETDIKDAKSLDKLNISPSIIRHWLRHTVTHDDDEDTHRFLLRIDNMFQITNTPMKALRRIVTLWHDTDVTQRHEVIVKLKRRENDWLAVEY